ncbi:uncharacterized protein LOC131929627 [Physella acuta]|uniref:uncharacterized protein LOC131929627 n=1 Tax=Physella acuta TaxID=109671 RepID=UPI0027DE7DF2|nr:uncharacterized protein LOC131929627 [Physella acuta]XP_059141905.1 uncharacterized protein LOC131929627 [Physella acuta]
MYGDAVPGVEVTVIDPARDQHHGMRKAQSDGAEMHLLSPSEDLHDPLSIHGENSVDDLLGRSPKRSCHNSYTNLSPKDMKHEVRIMEVLPSEGRDSSTDGATHSTVHYNWKMPLHIFSSKKTDEIGVDTKSLPKGIKLYYERQDKLISAYESIATDSKLDMLSRNIPESSTIVTRLSQISLLVNLSLMIAKAVAVGMSNSLSIISSLVDSVVDLVSGIIIWWTTRAIRKSSVYVYPVGRSRLEPVAIIVLSVIMSLASLEVLISSIRKMISLSSSKEDIANFEIPTVVIAASTVVIKFTLAVSFYFVMKRKNMQSNPVDALIQDHRNDTVSNLVAIVCGYLGSQQFADRVNTKEVAYIDPGGAIIIALYIIINWWKTGIAQLRMITGYTADPSFLSEITWISLNHSPSILCIDTVRAFHFGSKFLVEVDIVLQEDTVLSESHNIGESLQQKLEKLSNVERAFVHVDYEVSHRPQDEHLTT